MASPTGHRTAHSEHGISKRGSYTTALSTNRAWHHPEQKAGQNWVHGREHSTQEASAKQNWQEEHSVKLGYGCLSRDEGEELAVGVCVGGGGGGGGESMRDLGKSI